jgi:hypothetical protein
MSDFYLGFDGDIKISSNKDIALVQSTAQNDLQQIYLRMMTEPGDFYVYPKLGVALSSLYGMPQDPATAEYGKRLIREALDREGVFRGKNIQIKAVPTSPDSIRFDVQLITSYGEPVVLSINQNL